jgi:ubiquitin-protein ligase
MAAPAASVRIMREVDALEKLRTGSDPSGLKFLLDQSPVTNPSSNIILGRILPNSDIFNQAAFQIEIKLLEGYPFKAPEVRFVTPIYHPNVDENGKSCLALLTSGETFKPTTSLTDIVRAVVHLIDNPDLDHALNLGNNSPFAC